MTDLETKEQTLIDYLNSFPSLAIAYSGGVDSSFLAYIACNKAKVNVILLIADSPSLPRRELNDALELATKNNWPIKTIHTFEHKNNNYLENPTNRCFFCKDELFKQMKTYCLENNITTIAYGAIMDDLLEYRAGEQAAKNHKVIAPLQQADLSKEEIRLLSEKYQLATASKPSFACLASRIPHNNVISVKKLEQIEFAEDILNSYNFYQFRARHHDNICRIQINYQDINILLDNRQEIIEKIKQIGYEFVCIDLQEYHRKTIKN